MASRMASRMASEMPSRIAIRSPTAVHLRETSSGTGGPAPETPRAMYIAPEPGRCAAIPRHQMATERPGRPKCCGAIQVVPRPPRYPGQLAFPRRLVPDQRPLQLATQVQTASVSESGDTEAAGTSPSRPVPGCQPATPTTLTRGPASGGGRDADGQSPAPEQRVPSHCLA